MGILTKVIFEWVPKPFNSFSRRFDSLFVMDSTVADCDITHVRSAPNKGPERYSFSQKSTRYMIIDHGGTCSEESKTWDPSYSTDDFIVFTVALSGYCRYVPDNKSQVSHREL